VGTSVHWMPLHLHPFYARTFRIGSEDLPVASQEWERLVSLPIFPDMTLEEQDHVIRSITEIARETLATIR
jgi:dTDP-4-amino-4,6-dideoxygalactose transaminase